MNSLNDVMQKFQNDLNFRQELKKSTDEAALKSTLKTAGIELTKDDLNKFGKAVLGDKLDPKINK